MECQTQILGGHNGIVNMKCTVLPNRLLGYQVFSIIWIFLNLGVGVFQGFILE